MRSMDVRVSPCGDILFTDSTGIQNTLKPEQAVVVARMLGRDADMLNDLSIQLLLATEEANRKRTGMQEAVSYLDRCMAKTKELFPDAEPDPIGATRPPGGEPASSSGNREQGPIADSAGDRQSLAASAARALAYRLQPLCLLLNAFI